MDQRETKGSIGGFGWYIEEWWWWCNNYGEWKTYITIKMKGETYVLIYSYVVKVEDRNIMQKEAEKKLKYKS